jgi:hypothetical protein
MSKNQSTLDRGLRIAVGLGLLSLTVIGPQSAWGLVGLLPLVTGITGYCPAYSVLGVSTCPSPKAPAT